MAGLGHYYCYYFIIIIIIIITRLVTRHNYYVNRSEAMNRWRGWSSIVVTQPSTSHHLV